MPRMPDTAKVLMGKPENDDAVKTFDVCDVGRCSDNPRTGGIGCGAEIFWCYTGRVRADGKAVSIPIDVEADEKGVHVAHWATCPNASTFRTSPPTSRRPSPQDRAAGE